MSFDSGYSVAAHVAFLNLCLVFYVVCIWYYVAKIGSKTSIMNLVPYPELNFVMLKRRVLK